MIIILHILNCVLQSIYSDDSTKSTCDVVLHRYTDVCVCFQTGPEYGPCGDLLKSHIPELELLHRGKVRDVYAVDEDRLLIVSTDRLSAFDVVMKTGNY